MLQCAPRAFTVAVTYHPRDMIRRVTAATLPKKPAEVVLTMEPDGVRPYSVTRELFNGNALRTLERWGVHDPAKFLVTCVREGRATVSC